MNFTSSAPAIIHSSEDVAETSGNGNGLIEPGETLSLTVTLRNFGAPAYNVSAKLLSNSGHVTVNDSASQFFDIATGDSAHNASNPFTMVVDSVTPPGSTLDFLLIMYSSATYCDTSQFSLFVEDEHHESDDEPEIAYAISQNYPNPFSSTTTITYFLPHGGPVRISLYTASGRWVKTLVNQIKDPGQHSLTLSGYGLKPGVYIVRLDTPSKSLTRACAIIR